MVLEREDISPIENWSELEVYNWFKEIKLFDYLNLIKYKKLNGKDILNANNKFFIDNLGMEDDIIFKLRYEINKIKNNSFCKNMKLWGYGYNKNGQLGQMNYEKDYLKNLTKINLPVLKEENDFIISIKANKNYSVLLTKFGEVYITGNYSMKKKNEEFLGKKYYNENDNDNNTNTNTNNNQRFKWNNHAMNKKIKEIKKKAQFPIIIRIKKIHQKIKIIIING
jgi:hypothetical protein